VTALDDFLGVGGLIPGRDWTYKLLDDVIETGFNSARTIHLMIGELVHVFE